MTGRADARRPADWKSFVDRLLTFLKLELAPYPGRMEMALMTALLCSVTVILEETWQVPLTAYSAYIVFFASERESTSSILNGLLCICGATVAVALALGIYTVSIGEPALRLPLMGAVIFLAMYLMRVLSLGPLSLGIGFVIAMSLTMVDSMPHAMPLLEDYLTKRVLWLWVVGALPFALIIISNAIMGRRPETMLGQGIGERLQAAGEALAGGMTPRLRARIAYYNGVGPDQLVSALNRGGILHRSFAARSRTYKKYIFCAVRILRLTEEWDKAAQAGRAAPVQSGAYGEFLMELARNIGKGELSVPSPDPEPEKLPAREGPGAIFPAEIGNTIRTFSDADSPEQETARPGTAPGAVSIAEDAVTNPDHVRFALKATLAILIAYISYSIVDWPGIRTCMVTCFFVSLSSLGESAHKLTLRMAGALVGCSLGMLSIIFLIPRMTDVGQLAILIAAVSFAAGWVMFSSDRLSYAGMQIAMAFFFCVLVGYGPSIDLTEVRDRIIGILWGNVIVSVVFAALWPVSALALARQAVASSLRRMSGLIAAPGSYDACLELESELAKARKLGMLDPFEPATLKKPYRRLLADGRLIRSLAVPVQAVSLRAATGAGPGEAAYRENLGAWLRQAADAVEKNRGTRNLPPLPRPGTRDEWHEELGKRAGELDDLLRTGAEA